jgi:hypothetical protein
MKKRKDKSELKSIRFTLDELCLIKNHVKREIGEDKAFEGMMGYEREDDEYAEELAKSVVRKIQNEV